MDNIKIDFESLLPYVIDAYTNIYGEEYRDIISKRINNMVIFYYMDLEGLSGYILGIKHCKKRECSIKFLDKLGFDVKEYIKDNYTKPLDKYIEQLLENYIDSAELGFGGDISYFVPLKAFDENNKSFPSKIKTNKLKIINHLLGDDHEKITEDTLEAFLQTEKYQEILKKIKELNIVYDEIAKEYSEWEERLKPLEDYIKNEEQRKKEFLDKKKLEVFEYLYSRLPLDIVDVLSDKTSEEQCNIILGYTDIGFSSNIESFHSEKMKELYDCNISPEKKWYIVFAQSIYLKTLGITIPNDKMLKCETEEDINNYLDFINQENIKKYIPSIDLVNWIKDIREQKYEEAITEYLKTREDIINFLDNYLNDFQYFYNNIKNSRVCIEPRGAMRNTDNEFISVMFYTIRDFECGKLSLTFMHECGHAIDHDRHACGFEAIEDFNKNGRKNPYDDKYRIYEKFNETLNDIFCIEANNFLKQKGIYLIEPKQYTSDDVMNDNTALITKELLYPLIERFKEQIIRAKINVNPLELIDCIGNDNFEELVDAVNKVDYLSRNGLLKKITNPTDLMTIEYLEQLERVKQIYVNIDKYYNDNVDLLEVQVNKK